MRVLVPGGVTFLVMIGDGRDDVVDGRADVLSEVLRKGAFRS
jgi:hypothetical protein